MLFSACASVAHGRSSYECGRDVEVDDDDEDDHGGGGGSSRLMDAGVS